MRTLEQLLVRGIPEGEEVSPEWLAEMISEEEVVWTDPDVDEHRWFTSQSRVCEIYDDEEGVSRYFMYNHLMDKGEWNDNISDLLPHIVQDAVEVYPKEVMTTIYVTKEALENDNNQ